MSVLCYPAQSQRIEISPPYAIESQLETTASFERFPWLLEALRGLQIAYDSGRVMPGIGDLRISLETITFARRLLSLVANPRLPVPRITPISGGGLGLVWNVAGKEAVLTIYPNDERLAYMLSNEADELVSDGLLTLEQPRSLNSLLSWLVER
jgi:hypothetical protein